VARGRRASLRGADASLPGCSSCSNLLGRSVPCDLRGWAGFQPKPTVKRTREEGRTEGRRHVLDTFDCNDMTRRDETISQIRLFDSESRVGTGLFQCCL
jgi:hypothetical protein